MKIFMKLYLGMIALLVSALLISAYFIVNTTLEKNLQHEIDSGMSSHNMLINAIQTNLVLATMSKPANEDLIYNIVVLTKGSNILPCIVAIGDEVMYGDMMTPYDPSKATPGYVTYNIVKEGSATYIVYYSTFKIRYTDFVFATETDITGIIAENNQLRKRYFLIYLLVLLGGTVIALAFSVHLTRPIRLLRDASEKMMQGDYTARIPKVSKDEIGQLTEVYNEMAETIQDKVEELNLSVKQKEDFVAAFAHETKTPMTSIIGYADLIYQDRLPANKRKEAAYVVMNEGMRLQALSRKLLDIVALEKENIFLEETNLADMKVDIENTLWVKAEERNVAIIYNIEDDYLYLDYDLFKTVIVNLIDNSIKAGANIIHFSGKRDGDHYIFEISDNGIGIPEDELNRVKDAFYMVDKSRSRAEHGAGLGLALCDKIIHLHKGKMNIDSVLGEGTVIRLILNAVE